ncbi:MAG: hypothetical protein ABW022_22025 [Actinoplanes sp.]
MPPVNNVWASNTAEGDAEELTLPSGQTCLAVKLGMEGLISAGILAEADSLTAIVTDKHVRKVRGGKGVADGIEVDNKSLMKDAGAMMSIITLADKALPHIVQSPDVRLHYVTNPDGSTTKIPKEKREPGIIYTDQVGFEDKMFLFEFCMGNLAGELATFRGESPDALGAMATRTVVPVKAKRPSRNR